jgi:putative transcriptional regulator
MTKPIIISRNEKDSLAGHLLVATPQTQDMFFERSVIYLCEHNQEGAMGIIVNSPIEKVTVNEILDQMNLSGPIGDRDFSIMFGGPVEAHRGFMIHNGAHLSETSITSRDGISVSANAQLLKDWVEGRFSAKAMLALGYAGWSPGQLELEIERGSWEVISASEALIFDTHHENKWNLAVAKLGFDLGNLSSTVGHA